MFNMQPLALDVLMDVTQMCLQYQYVYKGMKDPSSLFFNRAPDVYRVIAMNGFPSAVGRIITVLPPGNPDSFH